MTFALLSLPWIFVGVVGSVVTSSSTSLFKMATNASGAILCAAETPSIVCNVSDLQTTLSSSSSATCRPVPGAVLCSWKCRKQQNCVSFNWKSTSQQCELFTYAPSGCLSVPGCTHYESQLCGQRSCGTELFNVTADNEVRNLFVDGCEMIGQMPNAANWMATDTLSIPVTTGVIAVYMHNDPNSPGGLLGSGVTFDTNRAWKISTSLDQGWMGAAFDDSAWSDAAEYGANGASPWELRAGIKTTAQWITANPQSQTDVYFRYRVKPMT